jgi:hypothetical protein
MSIVDIPLILILGVLLVSALVLVFDRRLDAAPTGKETS